MEGEAVPFFDSNGRLIAMQDPLRRRRRRRRLQLPSPAEIYRLISQSTLTEIIQAECSVFTSLSFSRPFSLSLSLTLCLSLSLSLCLSLPLNHSLTLSCLSFSRSHLSLTLYYLSLCLSLCLSLVYISVSVILALRLSLPPTFDLFTDFSLFLNAYVHLCKSACTFSYSFVSMLIRLSYNLVRCSSVINMTKGSLVIIDNCSSSAYALF